MRTERQRQLQRRDRTRDCAFHSEHSQRGTTKENERDRHAVQERYEGETDKVHREGRGEPAGHLGVKQPLGG